ncbi:ankyrin [Mollisia scopiformis]|uniref:Ankyrin n=1 Tax=Mollisia scopiformis TaxID=149040 RepID=A0A194XIY4_MOLSC|nr:ankyrin [Mollisia scopiformis]KUJ19727.1 ankyrin [Mollisia scopiformis]
MAKLLDHYKSEIHSLYIADGRSLEDVQRILEGRHNCHASIRTYRTKLAKWNMLKKKASPRRQVAKKTKLDSSLVVQTLNTAQQTRTVPGVPSVAELEVPTTWATPLSSGLRHSFNSSDPNAIENSNLHDSLATGNTGIAQESDLTSRSRLFDAILNGDEEEVTEMLFSGTSIRMRDTNNNTPLHAAILKGNVAIVNSILNYRADIDATGFKRRAPLHLAIASKTLAQLLLKRSPILSPQDDEGNTPLHFLLNTKDWWDDQDATTLISSLLSSGADVNIINRFGESPLHRVVSEALPRSLRYLNLLSQFLDHNPDVASPMRNGMTLIHVFLTQSKILALRYTWRGQFSEEYDCLRKFLTAGADSDTMVDSKPLIIQCLSIHYFSEHAKFEGFLRQLIQSANIDVKDDAGNYPLHLILKRLPRGVYEMTAALISRSASLVQTNNEGATPLEIWLQKTRRMRSELVKVTLLLVEAGADIMMPTSTGKSLFDMLYWLKNDDQIALTKAFLKTGATPRENAPSAASPSEWVQIWRAAWRQSSWLSAQARMIELEQCHSRPKTIHFMDCAYFTIIEKQLEFHKSKLKDWQEGAVEKESVISNYEEYCAILRVCRERVIEIDVSWYTKLLDLMDFK